MLTNQCQIWVSIIRRYRVNLWAAILISFGLASFILSSHTLATSEAFKTVDPIETKHLQQVFPDATVFSIKQGELPHHKAYSVDPESGNLTLLGFVFETQEIEPEELAYSSLANALVGLTTDGHIKRVQILGHYEPYGFISIDPDRYARQFEGKSILDAFRVGRDLDAVSGATITLRGTSRLIRKSARRVAQQHLIEAGKSQ